MRDGCILNGGVGSGKSRTGLFYYFSQYGGDIYPGKYIPMKGDIPDLYIITTAAKRDKLEWEGELVPFLLSPKPEYNEYNNKIIIDSWNNITKYKDVSDAFFIFDEDRITGNGVWVKIFLTIAKHNRWIVLSATPGDKWEDYIPVFLANGFYKNITEFRREHIVYSQYCKFPKVDRYLNVRRLERLRELVLIDMEFERHTTAYHEDIYCDYDKDLYREVVRNRWDPFKNEPIPRASEFCYVLRHVVNIDESRQVKLLEILEKTPRAIIFYNFDYELELLKDILINWISTDTNNLGETISIGEWNGHKHQPVPETERWVYLVQYTAGCEGWNSISTNTIIFFSQNYSYKVMVQASGRIDRLNTPYTDLYYYHLKSRAGIDVAISKALKDKKKFNERKFAKWD